MKLTSLLLALALGIVTAPAAFAASDTMKFSYKNADIKKAIEDYAAKSGQKFIVDPSVRGMITVINDQPVSLEEAFNDLSTALAINGLAISKRDGVMVVMQALYVLVRLAADTHMPDSFPHSYSCNLFL